MEYTKEEIVAQAKYLMDRDKNNILIQDDFTFYWIECIRPLLSMMVCESESVLEEQIAPEIFNQWGCPYERNFNIMEELNKILVDIEPNRKLNIALAKKDRVDYIYNTSALEGNTMTYPEVETLLDGITVGGHKLCDENMILNQNKSIKLLFDLIENNKFDFTKFTICLLHNEVSQNEALKWGEFRDANVRIGGTDFIPPRHETLEKEFKKNFKFINNIREPIIQAFCSFLLNSRSQYFYDGNKRTARLMMNGILLNNGYPVLNIKVKHKLKFNKMMISYYDNNNLEESILWLYKYYKKQISELK